MARPMWSSCSCRRWARLSSAFMPRSSLLCLRVVDVERFLPVPCQRRERLGQHAFVEQRTAQGLAATARTRGQQGLVDQVALGMAAAQALGLAARSVEEVSA